MISASRAAVMSTGSERVKKSWNQGRESTDQNCLSRSFAAEKVGISRTLFFKKLPENHFCVHFDSFSFPVCGKMYVFINEKVVFFPKIRETGAKQKQVWRANTSKNVQIKERFLDLLGKHREFAGEILFFPKNEVKRRKNFSAIEYAECSPKIT